LTGLGLVPDKTYDYSSEVAAGLVISQDPTTGYSVAEGSTVKLVISQGKQAIQAPNVVGKDQNTAVAELSKAELTVTVNQEANEVYAAGIVIWQSVEAGKTVEEGTAISITVSTGSATPAEEVKYVCNYKLTVPNGVTAADITLYDGSGNVLSSWTHQEFSGAPDFTISVPGIVGSSTGTVKVTWYMPVIDEDGTTTESASTETYAVTFTKQ
jgi:serine/threonine-protein kinase